MQLRPNYRWTGLVILALEATRALAAEPDLDGVKSPYTLPLKDLVQTAAAAPANALPGLPPASIRLRIRAWTDPGDPLRIGAEQRMTIQAPLERVSKILDDLAHYPELFPDIKAVKGQLAEGQVTKTYWEQEVPVFFLKNIRYEMLYLARTLRPGLRAYRYQLANDGGTLNRSDGLILLESASNGTTRYLEYDFFDASWGLLKSILGTEGIWKKALEGIAVSDLAIRIRAEDPAGNPGTKPLESAAKQAKTLPIDEWVAKRKPIRFPLTAAGTDIP